VAPTIRVSLNGRRTTIASFRLTTLKQCPCSIRTGQQRPKVAGNVLHSAPVAGGTCHKGTAARRGVQSTRRMDGYGSLPAPLITFASLPASETHLNPLVECKSGPYTYGFAPRSERFRPGETKCWDAGIAWAPAVSIFGPRTSKKVGRENRP